MTEVEQVATAGFFRRNRELRLAVGIAITVILIAAYLFGIASYRSGIASSLPAQSPPAQGLSVVIVPDAIEATDQTVPSQVLAFPSSDLLDENGLLTNEIEIRVQPALSGSVLALPIGEAPTPQRVELPAPGIVQEYPFDSYALSSKISAQMVFADAYDPIPVDASLFLRIPGWSARDVETSSSSASAMSTVFASIVRDGSTKSIALLLLLLMVILAAIAVLVTGASTRGRMKLDLSVASWMTALLFALLPIRGFFPGSPPLGSWMDILVFFWVELILMVAVAAVVTTILLRARDVRIHPKEQS